MQGPISEPSASLPAHRYFVDTTPPAGEGTRPDDGQYGPATPEDELRGVGRVRIGALLAILGIALGFVFPIVYLVTTLAWLFTGGAARPPSGDTVKLEIETLLGVALLGMMLGIGAFVLSTSAFMTMRRIDRRFAAPAVLATIGVVGFGLLALGLGGILASLLSELQCLTTSTVSSACAADPGTLMFEQYAIEGGSFIAFVGWIGLALGVFRLGRLYGNGLLKAGGILYLIPFVNLLAPILTFAGATRVLRGLRAYLAQPPPPAESPSE